MAVDGYYPDLRAFSLAKLKDLLKTIRLIPSQRILREDIDGRFSTIEQTGVKNLEQLQKVLKIKSAVRSFSETTGVPVDYLTILRREVNSYHPKPVTLKDFPCVDPAVIRRLLEIGIKDTMQLFPYVLTPEDRNEFADRNHLKRDVLIESEYDTVEKVAQANHEELYHTLIRVNEQIGLYKGKFGVNDMELWIKTAVQEVPRVIRY